MDQTFTDYRIYKLEKGLCTCVLGDLYAGAKRVGVLKLSAKGVLIEPTCQLSNKQFVYTSIIFEGGPAFALSGIVVSSKKEGTLIEWLHSQKEEADKLDQKIRQYLQQIGKLPPEPPPLPKKKFPEKKFKAVPEIILAAGKVNLTETIRKKSKEIRSAVLASHMETVRVLNMASIANLIKEAVDESVTSMDQRLNEAERKRLLTEAEDVFKDKLELFKSQKAGLEEQARLLQRQLERAQTLLEEERNKVVHTQQFTVSDVGMVELEQRLGRMLDKSLQKGEVNQEIEQEMRHVVARLLDDEREKIRKKAQQAQNDRISLLEKKVSRLATSLESAESERDRAQRRAQALEAVGTIIPKNLVEAGLNEEDPNKERKLCLLKEIVQFNKDIRKQLQTEGRIPKVGSPKPQKQKKKKTKEKSPEAVPVLATGGEEDREDLSWVPDDKGPEEKLKTVRIKSLKKKK